MIVDFVRVLRAADLRVSPAETLEAAKIIEAVGLEDRSLLKVALSQGLAKTQGEKILFSECFDSYFAEFKEFKDKPPQEIPEEKQEEETSGQEKSLAEMLEGGERAALEMQMMQAANEVGLAEARLFTQTGLFTRRILEAMGLEGLDDAIRQGQGGDARREVLEAGRAALFEEVRDFVEAQIAMRTKNAGRLLREEALSRLKLGALDKSDMELLRVLTRKLAKKLATRHARRRKKNLRGVLDIRRTMRSNLAHDGLLFDLAWKRVKRDKPKLIVMCDVSGSVAAVAQFFLMFLYNLGDVMPRTRSFVFSNRCGEISATIADNDIDDAMREALRQFGGGSTDYGVAFSDLNELAGAAIDRHTTILILGDARSNYGDPGHKILRDFYGRAKRVIFLNPEPKSSWGGGDSEMGRLGAYCSESHVCNSLRHVERIIDSVLKYAA